MTFHPLLALGSVLFGVDVGLGAWPLAMSLYRFNRRFFDDVAAQMSDLGLDPSWLPAVSTARWAAAGAAVAGGVALGMAPVGLMAGGLIYQLVGAGLAAWVARQKTLIRDQLVLAARDYANQIRAGLPLVGGLEATSRELPAPLGPLLGRVVQQAQQNPGYFTRALERLKDEIRVDALTVFVVAVTVARERGGDLSRVLDRLAYSLEEMQRVERRKESETAAGRLVVWLLAGFPLGFLGLFYVLEPDGTGLLFTMPTGQIILAGVGVTVYFCVRWTQSILRKVE